VPRDDAALVDAFLRSLAAADDAREPLPEAAAILRRARLRETLEAEQRRVDRTAVPLLAAALAAPLAGLLVTAAPGGSGALLAAAAGLAALAGTFAVRLALIED
jgi:hypothetical protein